MKREPVDMSPEAIAARLEELRALYRLASSLKRARRIKPPPSADSKAR